MFGCSSDSQFRCAGGRGAEDGDHQRVYRRLHVGWEGGSAHFISESDVNVMGQCDASAHIRQHPIHTKWTR